MSDHVIMEWLRAKPGRYTRVTLRRWLAKIFLWEGREVAYVGEGETLRAAERDVAKQLLEATNV